MTTPATTRRSVAGRRTGYTISAIAGGILLHLINVTHSSATPSR
jgi:hypothetical protein